MYLAYGVYPRLVPRMLPSQYVQITETPDHHPGKKKNRFNFVIAALPEFK
jgi:hypothetical protein